MLLSFRDLRRFEVDGTDGRVGRVNDVLFDDRDWRIRYLVVDTGGFLKPHPVLLGPEQVERVASEERTVVVGVDRATVAASPPVETHPPVSSHHEETMRAYFGLPPLHTPPAPGVDVWGQPVDERAPHPVEVERRVMEAENHDPHLRSARTWLGYGVEGRGEHLGEVDDLLIRPVEQACVRYLVVDTGRWLPGAQRLVATDWISAVVHDARHVRVDADRERMREAPDFATAEEVDHGAERWLFHHYGFARKRA